MGCQLKNLSPVSDEDNQIKRKRKLEEDHPDIVAPINEDKKKKKKKKKNKSVEDGEKEENTHLNSDQKGDEKSEILNNGLELNEGLDEEIDGKKKKKSKKKKNKEVKEENTQLNSDQKGEKPKKNLENGLEFNEEISEKKKKKKKDDGVVVEEKKEYDGVVVSGKNSTDSKYAPLCLFSDSGLTNEVLECCKGFTKPSPIQAHAWPFLLDGRDFIGIAQTGSGKTLAFGVPAMMHVLGKRKVGKPKSGNPLCLILSPTRELAQQIADVLCSAGKSCGVKSSCFYGGTGKGPQRAELKFGVDMVIATPGRLKDLMGEGVCCLNEATFVVLDEADRMLDMGFEPDVRYILGETSSARQMVMFSATWPTAVHQLAQEFMDPNPVKVVVGSEDLAANHDVMQIVEVLEDQDRDHRLVSLLEKYHASQRNRVLVFVLYQKEADRVENMLLGKGWKVVGIHGGKQQGARTRSLAMFKSGQCPLLIATDVAARGLDIPDVEVVINYSFPLTTEDYVHRIGRTGRAGKKGVAHTFFTKVNKGLAGELVNVLREAGQHIPPDLVKFGTHVKMKESKLYGAHFREISADAPKATKITFGDSDED